MKSPGTFVRLASRLIRPPAGYRHLFAYASYLDRRVLEAIGLEPHFVTVAHYESRRWIIDTHGYPTIVPRRGHQVWGIIWKIPEIQLAALDILQGVPSTSERYGCFARNAEGALCISEFYATKDRGFGVAKRSVLEPILASTRHWGFPPAYIDELSQWSSKLEVERIGGAR